MFTLINLPYAPEALEPVISAKTLGFHHGKHLQGYVNNLNAALPGSPFEGLPLEEIVQKASGGVFNNAGQILNHNLYFTQFKPVAGAPVYSGPVVWLKDASQNALVAARLMNDEQKVEQELAEKYQHLRENYQQEQEKLASIEQARENKLDLF